MAICSSPEARENHFPEDRLELGVLVQVNENVAGGVQDEQPVAEDRHVLHPERPLTVLLARRPS